MPSFRLRCAAILTAGFAVLAGGAPVRADHAPVFVVPSRPGVPVAINGCDASWSVVEGDIGLARPGHLTPMIIGPCRPLPRRTSYHRNPYYPRYGVEPMRGRNEVDPGPDRWMPEPAESFHRSWSTSSESQYSQPQYSQQRSSAPRYSETPHDRPQSYSAESEHLPPTIEDPQQLAPPPIVVVPHRGRRH
jgi:hypothetical protein